MKNFFSSKKIVKTQWFRPLGVYHWDLTRKIVNFFSRKDWDFFLPVFRSFSLDRSLSAIMFRKQFGYYARTWMRDEYWVLKWPSIFEALERRQWPWVWSTLNNTWKNSLTKQVRFWFTRILGLCMTQGVRTRIHRRLRHLTVTQKSVMRRSRNFSNVR